MKMLFHRNCASNTAFNSSWPIIKKCNLPLLNKGHPEVIL